MHSMLLGKLFDRCRIAYIQCDIYCVKSTCCCLQIDLQTFLTLTDQDLKELGITTFGARRKMLLAISGTNEEHVFVSFYFSCHPRPCLALLSIFQQNQNLTNNTVYKHNARYRDIHIWPPLSWSRVLTVYSFWRQFKQGCSCVSLIFFRAATSLSGAQPCRRQKVFSSWQRSSPLDFNAIGGPYYLQGGR